MTTTVGVFDSGVGGLTVVAALHALLPALPIRYLADTAYVPYGERSAAEVEARALVLAARLVDEGCALLVVACNTATSAAIETLRERFAVPVVGMEPPLKPALAQSGRGRVAVLVTPSTARGERLERLRRAYAGTAEVVTVALPGLADLVEEGAVSGPAIDALLRRELAALPAGVDAVALGCTHYGFVRGAIERVLGPGVRVVDAAEAVARRVQQQLAEHGLALPEGAAVAVECAATGDAEAFASTVGRLQAAGAVLPPLYVLRPEAAGEGRA